MTGNPLPRALELLWQQAAPPRRSGGLSRERIVVAAIELADADGLAALSMARLADRLGCGTMSIYRHVANKDELVLFMLSTAAEPPPSTAGDWRITLAQWADALWQVYHRHPWILRAAAAGPPADPGQLAWLEAGLGALRATALAERDKLSAVISLLHYVRGAAALDIESGVVASEIDWSRYPEMLTALVDPERFPAVSAALAGGAFDTQPDADPLASFRDGVQRVLDGIEAHLHRSSSR